MVRHAPVMRCVLVNHILSIVRASSIGSACVMRRHLNRSHRMERPHARKVGIVLSNKIPPNESFSS